MDTAHTDQPVPATGAPGAREHQSKRILLVDITPGFGGVEMRVLMMARALQGRVGCCHVAVTPGSPLHGYLISEGLPCIPIHGSLRSPGILYRLYRLMRQQRYTIIDAHNVPSMLWGQLAAYAAGISGRVSTIQSFYNREYTGLKGRIYSSVLFFNSFLSTHYVAVAPGIQDQLVKQGYQSSLIPNIIAIPPMEEPPADVPQRQAWGFGPDDFVIGIVARLDPVKGHTLLLQALAQAHECPRMKLLIIGDGPLRPKLEAETLRLGLAARVHFMGFQSNVQQLLPRIDCLCVASLSEGMPFAVLEAAVQAKPIVATAVGGLVSLLEHNHTAVLVEPNDPAALAAGLLWMAEHPEQARSMGQAVYAHVCAIMSIDRFIAATLDVYGQVHR